MGYPTQLSMSGKLTKGDIEYHTSILQDEINFEWSKIEFKYQGEPIFFPPVIQIPLHGKFKTRKLITFLDTKNRIGIQCQNSICALKEHEIVQPTLRVFTEVRDEYDYDINDIHDDIIEKLIHLETYEIMLNESANQQEKPNQMLENNQNEDVNQIKVQIGPIPHSLRKIKCTHCKHYLYVNNANLM